MSENLNVKLDKNLYETRIYTRSTINQAFNDFLHLQSSDNKLLQYYHEILMQGGVP